MPSEYLVYSPTIERHQHGNGARFPTQDEAINSAKILASKHSDREVFVYRAVQSVTFCNNPYRYKQYSKDAKKENVEPEHTRCNVCGWLHKTGAPCPLPKGP